MSDTTVSLVRYCLVGKVCGGLGILVPKSWECKIIEFVASNDEEARNMVKTSYPYVYDPRLYKEVI